MVPGAYKMGNKDELVEFAKDYAAYFEGREHCYTPWDYIPKTYLMADPDDCQEIIGILSKQTTDEIKYMGKESRGVHRGKGISLMTLDAIETILEEYENGQKCKQKRKDTYIIQKYIPSPLLIKGRKMDFRCFMVLASMDPLIVFYQDGIVRLASDEFDEHSTDITAHLTNLSVSKENLANQTEEEA